MPFFSIIIPLYNKENYIENAIKSVLNQTFADFEIIIVNDCSTDKSLEAAKRIVSEKIRILQHEKNKGLSASRNTGIKNANSNYIAFLDADDLWKPNYLEEIKSLIQDYPTAKLFATNYEEIYPNNLIFLPKNNASLLKPKQLIDDYFKISLGQPLYCACSLCVEKSVFSVIGTYNESVTYSEDIDFNIRANVAFQLAYSVKPLVSYNIFSENQITNSKFKNKVIPNFDLYEEAAKKNKNLKKYLDFNRYVFAKQYKVENAQKKFNDLKSKIDFKNLSWKQSLLLNLPVSLLIMVMKLKQLLVKNGLKITTYSKIE